MMGTINCTYETPCGWCTKWDKKCDKKIGYIKSSNNDAIIPCYNCARRGPKKTPECEKCDTTNGFKYFKSKENNSCKE